MIMELWYSLVIGTVAFAYIHLYIRNARQYFESGKTQSIGDVFAVGESGIRTHETIRQQILSLPR